jgi:hypothetical protein
VTTSWKKAASNASSPAVLPAHFLASAGTAASSRYTPMAVLTLRGRALRARSAWASAESGGGLEGILLLGGGIADGLGIASRGGWRGDIRGDGRGHAGGGGGGGGRRSHESGLHYALNSCRDRGRGHIGEILYMDDKQKQPVGSFMSLAHLFNKTLWCVMVENTNCTILEV